MLKLKHPVMRVYVISSVAVSPSSESAYKAGPSPDPVLPSGAGLQESPNGWEVVDKDEKSGGEVGFDHQSMNASSSKSMKNPRVVGALPLRSR